MQKTRNPAQGFYHISEESDKVLLSEIIVICDRKLPTTPLEILKNPFRAYDWLAAVNPEITDM